MRLRDDCNDGKAQSRRLVVLLDDRGYLVQDRMGRTGARWSLAGAEAVLRLRALRASGDFDDYWQFHLAKEHERTHRSRYADGAIPNPLPPSRPKLRLVK